MHREMSHAEFVRYMRTLEMAADLRERESGLVLIGDCWLTPETAKEIREELGL